MSGVVWVEYGEPKSYSTKGASRSIAINTDIAERHGLRISVTGGVRYYHCPICNSGWIFALDAKNCHRVEPKNPKKERRERLLEYSDADVECEGETRPEAKWISGARIGQLLGWNIRTNAGKRRIWAWRKDNKIKGIHVGFITKDNCKMVYERAAFYDAKEKMQGPKKFLVTLDIAHD